MKTCFKLIISSLFLSFYTLNLINGESCSPSKCPESVTTSTFSTNFSVEYPFRLKDQQEKSCGVPGFDLYCNETLGTLIQLPDNVVLRVDDISYYYQHVIVSDPYNCLPQTLMSLNLTNTLFRGGYTENFWLYNCSGGDFRSEYDRIDCLSGPNYTVISSWYDISGFGSSGCSFVKILRAPKSHYSSNYEYILSSISTIDLTWTGLLTPPPPRNFFDQSYTSAPALLPALMGVVFATLLILYFCCRCCLRKNVHATSTSPNTNTNVTTRHLSTTRAVVVGGLDQVTIDSYPVVVLGESGLLKPDDDACAICLSDYEPQDMLKMLPQCLHRFHKDCIDQWLRSKGVCPICRTPPRIS